MPSISNVGALFAKVETTAGTDAVPTSTDYILAIDATYNPDMTVIERNYLRPSLSQTPHIMGMQLASLTFTTEVVGSGTANLVGTPGAAAPTWATLFQGCAMDPGVNITNPSPWGKVYKPLTGSLTNVLLGGNGQKTLTFYMEIDGRLHKMTGSMGTFSLVGEAGQIGRIQWTFTGSYVAPTDFDNPTPAPIAGATPNATVPPLIENCSFTIGSTIADKFSIQQLGINFNNSVIQRKSASFPKGFRSMFITGRSVEVTFTTEFASETDHPFWADYVAATKKSVSFQFGSAASGATNGNTMIVTVPNAQISSLGYSDADGLRMVDVTMRASTATHAGNDEIEFKFV